GGVMMYDITNPLAPVYVGYANNRGPDRGAEGIILIPADQSPNGKNIVILSNETSSTLTIYEINPCAAPGLAGIANNGSLTICAGDSVKLYNSNSTTTTTYQWMLNGNEVAGATDSVLYVDQAGAYSLFAYNANGCENTSSVINTQAVALPVANIMNSGALTYCAGDSVKLSDANHAAGNAYTWTLNGNAISSATDSVYYANQSGIFGFSVIDANGCKDSSLTLTTQTVNYPVISVSASGVTTFCSGDSVTFTLPQNNNYTYQWINGSTLLLNETDTTLTVNATGNYAVIVSNSGLCADTSATNTVTVNAVPTIPVISQTGLDLSTASAANYQWYFNGNTISGANTQNYTAIQNGIYAVEITDNNGCTSMSADLSINSISLKNISVVNNISVYPNPNKGNITISVSGDQKNITIELFDIMGKKLETIHSGSLLSKETINYTLPALVADGIYFIKVKGVSFEKTERIILQR
ncbi:MAG TPA: T9SS type A sorting domain-containing protein, partial [Bacteroidia bacterium]